MTFEESTILLFSSIEDNHVHDIILKQCQFLLYKAAQKFQTREKKLKNDLNVGLDEGFTAATQPRKPNLEANVQRVFALHGIHKHTH